jgi:hypothetical protein
MEFRVHDRHLNRKGNSGGDRSMTLEEINKARDHYMGSYLEGRITWQEYEGFMGALDRWEGTTLKLTDQEIERYAPYHTFPEFKIAFDAYMAGRRYEGDPNSVGGQAADRGAECAMRRQRIQFKSVGATRQNKGR